jgi:hypothetical protein
MTIRGILQRRSTTVIAAAAIVVSLGGVGTAAASNTIGSGDIRNGSIRSVDIANGGVHKVDLGPGSVGFDQLTSTLKHGMTKGTIRNLESDGPYPGATQLQQGDNSTVKWTGDGGATLQTSWVQCAPGKTAIGGGFSRADDSAAAIHDLQIVTSRPAQFQGGAEIAKPIPGDVDGSFVPNAWLVEGFNNAASGELIVRPWVVCVTIK